MTNRATTTVSELKPVPPEEVNTGKVGLMAEVNAGKFCRLFGPVSITGATNNLVQGNFIGINALGIGWSGNRRMVGLP